MFFCKKRMFVKYKKLLSELICIGWKSSAKIVQMKGREI